MSNGLMIFENNEVMIFAKDDVNFEFKGDFLIRAKNVADVLEYNKTEKFTNIVKDKYIVKIKNSDISDSPKWGNRKLNNAGETFITSFGLNQGLANSTMPKAEPFQDWLYEDVLPSIQKTGQYNMTVTHSYMIEDPIKRAEKWIEEQKEKLMLEQRVLEYEPKVTYYDTILQSTDAVNITQIAKDYGLSGKKLNEILHEEEIQYKLGSQWLLYQKHAENGYTKSTTQTFSKPDGTTGTAMHTKWTQKGKLFIHGLLGKHGIKALIDKDENTYLN